MYFNLKRSLLVISFISVGLYSENGLASGNHGSHDHSKENHSQKSENAKNTERKTLSQASKKSVVAALQANEALHSSFFKYNGKLVEENAMKLKKAIKAIEDKDIAKLLKFSKEKLSEIKASKDREENNKTYNLVSLALIHIVNKYDVGEKYNAYSCPMVKKKWVQNSKKMAKVHNPYAPKMPHCGVQDSHY